MVAEVQTLDTPIGELTLVVADDVLTALALPGRWPIVRERVERAGGALPDAGAASGRVADALRAYFDGDVDAIDGVEVAPEGSEFQRRTWRALRGVPPGTTVSYREIAERLGRPTAYRAVATANATNPIAIVVPCHRVIHADGTISGFGGGVPMKRWLLRHEADARPFRLS